MSFSECITCFPRSCKVVIRSFDTSAGTLPPWISGREMCSQSDTGSMSKRNEAGFAALGVASSPSNTTCLLEVDGLGISWRIGLVGCCCLLSFRGGLGASCGSLFLVLRFEGSGLAGTLATLAGFGWVGIFSLAMKAISSEDSSASVSLVAGPRALPWIKSRSSSVPPMAATCSRSTSSVTFGSSSATFIFGFSWPSLRFRDDEL